ncbi:hypothetical protein EV421DRAFT_1913739 [Armillaria borealis]|uniref:Uncharacterized protein n=1 Tax=Armillaria borealis TaxID=47425 RepID=A0AA39IVW1_9AGAR|nr:hypothetical protein EV421DRAFT_1913739 [Armillaria borealis]
MPTLEEHLQLSCKPPFAQATLASKDLGMLPLQESIQCSRRSSNAASPSLRNFDEATPLKFEPSASLPMSSLRSLENRVNSCFNERKPYRCTSTCSPSTSKTTRMLIAEVHGQNMNLGQPIKNSRMVGAPLVPHRIHRDRDTEQSLSSVGTVTQTMMVRMMGRKADQSEDGLMKKNIPGWQLGKSAEQSSAQNSSKLSGSLTSTRPKCIVLNKSLLSGRAVNLDTVYMATHSNSINEVKTHPVSDRVTIRLTSGSSSSDAKKTIGIASEWSATWHTYARAVAVTFPHQVGELNAYHDYITSIFGSNVVDFHP